MEIRLPRMLDGHMQELARLHPVHLSATINLSPLSTATLVLAPDDPAVHVRQYVELYGPHGSLGIFRIASVTMIYGQQQEVQLEHGVTSLEDGEAPADAVYRGSLREILASILAEQEDKRWILGNVAAPDDQHELDCGGQLLLQAMLDAMELAPGYALSFDQSVFPWVINVIKLENTPGCECRMSRNADTVSISQDESEIVTRVYAENIPGGVMDGPTIGEWGVISRRLDTEDEENPEAFVRRYLDERKNPAISVEIDARELEKLTGETLDRFDVGMLCRVALPDWGQVVEERLITIYYDDLLRRPDSMRLTLSTSMRSTAKSLASAGRASRDNSRGLGRAYKYIHEFDKNLILMVHKDELISAINLSPEKILIASSRIELKGETIVQLLRGTRIDVSHLDTYSVYATEVLGGSVVGDLVEASTLLVGGTSYEGKSQTVVTRGRGVDAVGKQIINYVDHNGNNQSLGVVIDVSTYNLPTETINYLGE